MQADVARCFYPANDPFWSATRCTATRPAEPSPYAHRTRSGYSGVPLRTVLDNYSALIDDLEALLTAVLEAHADVRSSNPI